MRERMGSEVYTIGTSDVLGRYMVATRDVKAGELILKERALVSGPGINPEFPVCFGCLKDLGETYGTCNKCHLAPVCGVECETKWHHANTECDYYKRLRTEHGIDTNFLVSNLQVVMPLKCLSLKSHTEDGKLWSSLMNLESHTEERRKEPIWKYYDERVIKVLHSAGILGKDDFSTMHKICGILDVNSFELRGPAAEDKAKFGQLRGIYKTAAFMSHDCVGNTFVSVDDNFEMTVHASLPIKSGNAILFNYANPLESTQERLQRLAVGKYFRCRCKRCSDPTELGTYMGSIVCPRCHAGYVVPDDSLSSSTSWHCEKCNHEYSGKLIRTTYAEGRTLVEETDASDLHQLETLLLKFSKTFTPNSVLVVDIKQKIIACIRDLILTEPPPKTNIIKKLVGLCQDLVHLLDKIEPGISRLKGIAIYELHKPMLLLARRMNDSSNKITKEYLQQLRDCEKTLKTAVSFLIYEPQNSPEGRLMKLAMSELKDLRDDVQSVQSLIDPKPNNLKKTKK